MEFPRFITAIPVGKDELGNEKYNAVIQFDDETLIYLPEGGHLPYPKSIQQLIDIFLSSPETGELCVISSDIRESGDGEFSFDIGNGKETWTVFVDIHESVHRI